MTANEQKAGFENKRAPQRKNRRRAPRNFEETGYCGGGVLELEVLDEVELFTLPCFFFVLVADSVVVLCSAPSG